MKYFNPLLASAALSQNNRTANELREKEEGASHPKKREPWVKPTLKVKKRKDWTKVEAQAVSDTRKHHSPSPVIKNIDGST
jgi:hypothetical protein